MDSVVPGVGVDQPEHAGLGHVFRVGLDAAGRSRHALFFLVLSAASRLPLGLAYAFARRLGRLRHGGLRRGLQVDEDAVRALGGTPEQIDGWARLACELSASETMESHLLPRLADGSLERLIRVEGLEHLEAALAGGKGAILYSLHVRGQYTLFAALAKLGHAPSIVGRRPVHGMIPADRRFRQWRYSVLEERFGCRCIWMGPENFGVAVKAANVLRENGVVVMFVDSLHRKLGVEVSFLEGRWRFASGPALLAQTTGAPMLDFYVHRGEGWFPQIAEIGAPLAPCDSLAEMTQACATRLEQHVRRHPAQWKFFSRYEGSDVANPRVKAM